jgi:VIT1/CCC1 family predicted Fe2+/Mn2+ transporter
MEVWMATVFVLAAVAVGVFGQAWGSWLEHRRRLRAMDLIEKELSAGRQPPLELYGQLNEKRSIVRSPWASAIATILVGLAGILWLAYYSAGGGHTSRIIAVAAVAILALVVTLFNRRGDDER